MTKLTRSIQVAVAAAAVLAAVAATATGATDSRSAAPRNCAFQLRIGDVLPFTGDLAAYGANLDRAVKQAVVLQNAALKKAGLSDVLGHARRARRTGRRRRRRRSRPRRSSSR